MIVYSLQCAKNHRFEAWFRDSAAYEAQSARRAVACPECGSSKVTKAPMAPRLQRGARGESEPPAAETPPPPPAREGKRPVREAMMTRKMLESIRQQVEANCEYVGERFAEEARKIHYGEVEHRDIYGEAKDDEAAALSEEGVAFQRIPWPKRTDG